MVSRWSFVFTRKSLGDVLRRLKEALKTSGKLPEDVAKTSYKSLNFGLKDVLDWSEMEVSMTIF